MSGITVEFRQREIELPGAMVFDDDWRFIDAAGHGHFRDKTGFPTLEERHLGCDRDDCDAECLGERFFVCRQCGAEIEPGSHWQPPRTVPGRGEVRVQVGDFTYLLTPEQYQRCEEAMVEAFIATIPEDDVVHL